MTRSILKQLGGEPAYAAELLQSVADGNLDVDVKVKSGDDSSMLFCGPRHGGAPEAGDFRPAARG